MATYTHVKDIYIYIYIYMVTNNFIYLNNDAIIKDLVHKHIGEGFKLSHLHPNLWAR
jgi:hypothetical protein